MLNLALCLALSVCGAAEEVAEAPAVPDAIAKAIDNAQEIVVHISIGEREKTVTLKGQQKQLLLKGLAGTKVEASPSKWEIVGAIELVSADGSRTGWSILQTGQFEGGLRATEREYFRGFAISRVRELAESKQERDPEGQRRVE